MKQIFKYSLLLALTLILGTGSLQAQTIGCDDCSPTEKELVDQINLARMNPNEFIKVLEDLRPHFQGNLLSIPGEYKYQTREGVAALDNAINFLKKQKPTIAMTVKKGLSKGAKEHLDDQKNNPQISFYGKDGSSPDKRMSRYGKWTNPLGENIAYGALTAKGVVALFILSDGFPKRDLRVNLFNPKFKTFGIACGPHDTWQHFCVVDFSGNYIEKMGK